MPTARLMGTYNQSMDVKGRMAFPAKLRECIGDKLVVTLGIGGCLFVYSPEDFNKISDKIDKLPMAKRLPLQRKLVGWATDVEADKQGRILIQQSLREKVGLDKDVVVCGVSDHCEIWDAEKWRADEISDEELAMALDGSEI